MITLYKVSYGGNTGLCQAVDGDDAYEYMARRIGLDNSPIDVVEADEQDERWFTNMGGGYVHKTPAARREEKEEKEVD